MLPLSDDDLLKIRAQRVQAKLFANRSLIEGTKVSVRLNLNYRIKKDGQTYAIQTIHRGHTPRGRALGYDSAVTVRNATFFVDQPARRSIELGHTKFAMAAVVGDLSHSGIVLDGVLVRFNPKNTKYFERVDDGRPVLGAEEVTIFNTRAYARGRITYLEGDE